MKEKMLQLIKAHKTFILFAIYGIPPTIVSFLAYLLFVYPLGFPGFVGNAVAWVIGVSISFFLYRKFVFRSLETTAKGILKEFLKFVSMRITSGLMETGLVYLFVDILGLHKMIFKMAASLCAALLNYMISMVFVFKRRKDAKQKVKR